MRSASWGGRRDRRGAGSKPPAWSRDCIETAGNVAAAVEWFERAAEAPAPTPEAGRELLFDLGQTLEAADETARALAVYLELRSDAGEFRDVSSRIQRLTRAQAEG